MFYSLKERNEKKDGYKRNPDCIMNFYFTKSDSNIDSNFVKKRFLKMKIWSILCERIHTITHIPMDMIKDIFKKM